MGASTLCSFYAGDDYYYRSAEQLRRDCTALAIDHDIRELRVDGASWPQLTRRKISFMAEMLEVHPNGVVWLDVDSRILRRPPFLDGNGYDFGAVLRRLKTFRDFDPWIVTRIFMPNCFQFAGTERARSFARFLADLEAGADVDATDDFFLQEGFRRFPDDLSVNLFDPSLVAKSWEHKRDKTCLVYGASGQVDVHRNTLAQHEPPANDPAKLQSVVRNLSREAAKRGDSVTARVLSSEGLRLGPQNGKVALLAARLHLDAGDLASAESALAVAFDSQEQPAKLRDRANSIRLEIASRSRGGSVAKKAVSKLLEAASRTLGLRSDKI